MGDVAVPHESPPYSSYIAVCDYFLFPETGKTTRGFLSNDSDENCANCFYQSPTACRCRAIRNVSNPIDACVSRARVSFVPPAKKRRANAATSKLNEFAQGRLA